MAAHRLGVTCYTRAGIYPQRLLSFHFFSLSTGFCFTFFILNPASLSPLLLKIKTNGARRLFSCSGFQSFHTDESKSSINVNVNVNVNVCQANSQQSESL